MTAARPASECVFDASPRVAASLAAEIPLSERRPEQSKLRREPASDVEQSPQVPETRAEFLRWAWTVLADELWGRELWGREREQKFEDGAIRPSEEAYLVAALSSAKMRGGKPRPR